MKTQDDITRLEDRIHELEVQQEILRKQLLRAEMDQWESRIDDLDVQMHLGALELSDRVAPLVDTLRNRWLDAKEQLSAGSSTATDVVDALRAGLERAMKDIRTAVLDAKKVATR